MAFNPVALRCDAGREYRWKGELVVPGAIQRTPQLFRSLRGLIDRARQRGLLRTGRFLVPASASIALLLHLPGRRQP